MGLVQQDWAEIDGALFKSGATRKTKQGSLVKPGLQPHGPLMIGSRLLFAGDLEIELLNEPDSLGQTGLIGRTGQRIEPLPSRPQLEVSLQTGRQISIQFLAFAFRNAEIVRVRIDENKVSHTQRQCTQKEKSEFAFDLPVDIHRIGHGRD